MSDAVMQADRSTEQTSNSRTQFGYDPVGSQASHTEGPIARMIEDKTSQLPSDWFLWAAGASIVASLALHSVNRKEDGVFVGQWAPTFLILGLYNKLVKIAGSDRFSP